MDESIISLLSKDISFLKGVNLPFCNLKKYKEDFFLFILDLFTTRVKNVVKLFFILSSFSSLLMSFSISIFPLCLSQT